MIDTEEQLRIMSAMESKQYFASEFPCASDYLDDAISQGLHPTLAATSWLRSAIRTALHSEHGIGMAVVDDCKTRIMTGRIDRGTGWLEEEPLGTALGEIEKEIMLRMSEGEPPPTTPLKSRKTHKNQAPMPTQSPKAAESKSSSNEDGLYREIDQLREELKVTQNELTEASHEIMEVSIRSSNFYHGLLMDIGKVLNVEGIHDLKDAFLSRNKIKDIVEKIITAARPRQNPPLTIDAPLAQILTRISNKDDLDEIKELHRADLTQATTNAAAKSQQKPTQNPIQNNNKDATDSDLELTLERDRSARLQRTIDEQRSALNAHVAEIEHLRAELARGHEANTKIALQMQELKNGRDGRMRAAHELIGAITLDAHLARNE